MSFQKLDLLKAFDSLKSTGSMLIPLPNYVLEIRYNQEQHAWLYGKEGDAKHPVPDANRFEALGNLVTSVFYQLLTRGDKELVPSEDFVWARQRPYRPDVVRVEKGDYTRVGGDVICEICGCPYKDHIEVTGYSWLNRLCDGRLVHL